MYSLGSSENKGLVLDFEDDDVSEESEDSDSLQVFDDESLPPTNLVEPRGKIVVKDRYGYDIDYTQKIADELSYFQATGGLVSEGKAVDDLQDLINKMINSDKCTELRAKLAKIGAKNPKVYILTKGIQPKGFVLPDGSIFLNTALIKLCGYLDHCTDIVAHELNHLINDTFGAKVNSGYVTELTIGWLHELGADITKELVEAAEQNPEEAGKIIEIIAPENERGVIHQSGRARSTIKLAHLYGSDSDRSAQPPTPLTEAILDLPAPTHSNREKLEILLKSGEDNSKIIAQVSKLHGRDLKFLLDEYRRGFPLSDSSSQDEFSLKLDKEVLGRCKNEGLSDAESLMIVFNSYNYRRLLYLLPDIESAMRLFNFAKSPDNSKKYAENVKKVFKENGSSNYKLDAIADQIIGGIYPADKSPVKDGLGISDIQLFRILGDFFVLSNGLGLVVDCFFQYACKACLDENGQLIDEARLDSLLNGLKMRGITIERSQLDVLSVRFTRGHGYPTFSKKNDNVVIVKMRELLVEKNFDTVEISNFLHDLSTFKDKAEYNRSLKNELNRKLESLKKLVDDGEFGEEDRRDIFRKLAKNLESAKMPSHLMGVRAFLSGKHSSFDESWDQGEVDDNVDADTFSDQDYFKFQYKLQLLLAVFEKDGDIFYEELEQLLAEMKPFYESLDTVEKLNFLTPLLALPLDNLNSYSRKDAHLITSFQLYTGYNQNSVQMTYPLSVIDHQRFFQLINIDQLVAELDVAWEVTGWQDFLQKTDTWFEQLHLYHETVKVKKSSKEVFTAVDVPQHIFGESANQLICALPIRNTLAELLTKPILPADIPAFVDFVSYYIPDSLQKEEMIRDAHRNYLKNSDVSTQQKIDYIFLNVEDIEYDLITTVVAEIDDVLGDYADFRALADKKKASILEGNLEGGLAYLGHADFGTSFFVNERNSLALINTADLAKSQQNSQTLAVKWCELVFSAIRRNDIPLFDVQTQKVVLGGTGKEQFRSLKDVFLELQNLSQKKRAALIFKALTEVNGLMQNEDSKAAFANSVIDGLSIPTGLQASATTVGITQVESRYLVLPIVQTLTSNLFAGLNLDLVDFEALKELRVRTGGTLGSYAKIKDLVGEDFDLEGFLRSSTDEVVSYTGLSKIENPSEYLDTQNVRMTKQKADFLDIMRFKASENSAEVDVTLAKNTELRGSYATLKGAQVAGALPTRGIQIISQVTQFKDEKQSAAYAQALDQNPGMDEIIFRNELLARAELYPALKTFMVENKLRLKKRLAAGSLFTTYEGTIEKDGQIKEVVIQQLSPNAHMFIEKYFEQSESIFTAIANDSSKSETEQNQALYAIDVLKMSREWCRKNIKDENFERGLEHYVQMIESYKEATGQSIATPGLLFIQRAENPADELYGTRTLVKIMEKVPGRTVNQILQDPAVSSEFKQKIVTQVDRFFSFQLKKTVTIDGVEKIIVHSDPSVGNFMVDESVVGGQLYVIDLDMVMLMDQKEGQPFALLQEKNGALTTVRALDSLLNLILDKEKVRGFGQRTAKKISIIRQVKLSLDKLSSDRYEPLAISRSVNEVLRGMGYLIPLEYQLLFRSIIEKSVTRKKWVKR